MCFAEKAYLKDKKDKCVTAGADFLRYLQNHMQSRGSLVKKASLCHEACLKSAIGNPSQPVILAQVTAPLQNCWPKMHCAYTHPDNNY
jgi:hypothetical protein